MSGRAHTVGDQGSDLPGVMGDVASRSRWSRPKRMDGFSITGQRLGVDMIPIRGDRSGWRPTAAGQLLVGEAEQFLSGGYAYNLLAVGGSVPAWAWLGFLAHTPEDELEARADEVLDMGRADTDSLLWKGAVTLLVQEIVHTSELVDCTVSDVQEALVVDLEARAGSVASMMGVEPTRFIQEVCSVLARCREGNGR